MLINQEFLAEFTAAAFASYSVDCEDFAWGDEQKEPYILDGTTIVLPPYSHIFMSFRHVMIWENSDGHIVVRNHMGDIQTFRAIEVPAAFAYAMEV